MRKEEEERREGGGDIARLSFGSRREWGEGKGGRRRRHIIVNWLILLGEPFSESIAPLRGYIRKEEGREGEILAFLAESNNIAPSSSLSFLIFQHAMPC